MEEIQNGEALLSVGEIDKGVSHLANAVAVCAQPTQLLSVLQQTLTPQIFALLMQAVPSVQKQLATMKTDIDDDLE